MTLALVLLLALLAALPASAKPADLLPIGSRPPDITAHGMDGKAYHVRLRVGIKRVVLLMGMNQTYLDNVRQNAAPFAERDIEVLTAAGHAPAFYLVGKDGHIKLARHAPPTNAELFATIDAMPMRQTEMRRK